MAVKTPAKAAGNPGASAKSDPAASGTKKLKVAIVHDWLIGGGAERVIEALHELYPDAPIYTSYATDEWRERLHGKVVTGFLQRWPFSRLRKFVGVLRMWWFSHLDLSGYDLVISSTGNGEAFGARMPPSAVHICYCHTPTHYYWRHYDAYMRRPGFGVFDPLARLGLRLLVAPMRRWDWRAAQRVDYFIANSTHIQQDIKAYYGRDAEVIFPPIDVARFTVDVPASKRHGLLTVGRQAPHKHTDIIVEACTRLGLPLTVVGNGPDHAHLRKIAGPNVMFDMNATDQAVADYMAHAQGFIFASFDDFGITPIEAMAAGTPVIAFKAGGALDYIVPGKTGIFFGEQTADSLAKTLTTFDPSAFNPKVIRAHAQAFSPTIFKKQIQTFVQKTMADK